MVHRRKALMVEEEPCRPVVSSAKGGKIDPVPAQMASYLAGGWEERKEAYRISTKRLFSDPTRPPVC